MNLNNINYSSEDVEELTREFLKGNYKHLIRKPRKSEEMLFPQKSRSPRRKKSKRENKTLKQIYETFE